MSERRTPIPCRYVSKGADVRTCAEAYRFGVAACGACGPLLDVGPLERFDPLDAIEAVRVVGDCVDVAHTHLTRRSGGTLRLSSQEARALIALLVSALDVIEGKRNPEL